MADDADRARGFVRREGPAEPRTDPEQPEQPRRDACPLQRLGLTVPDEDPLQARIRLDPLEQSRLALPVLDHPGRLPPSTAVRAPRVQLHQAVRLGERHGVQQQAVDGGENRGGHADAEPQNEHDSDGEPGRPAQDAGAVAEVLQQRIEPVQAVGLAPRFLDGGHDSQSATRGDPDHVTAPQAHRNPKRPRSTPAPRLRRPDRDGLLRPPPAPVPCSCGRPVSSCGSRVQPVPADAHAVLACALRGVPAQLPSLHP